jgi:hypothetical protein
MSTWIEVLPGEVTSPYVGVAPLISGARVLLDMGGGTRSKKSL